ncbi:hypothetical protein K502DRAFT_350726 [Neoconidiobolus thromboides FSU 785]|nr:hypothetical protein K502DRAFT_350726 [Neoconidiobolus thromboides FSU 785]
MSKFSYAWVSLNIDEKAAQQYCFLKVQKFYHILSIISLSLRLIEEKTMGVEDQSKFSNVLKEIISKTFAVKEKYSDIMNSILLKAYKYEEYMFDKNINTSVQNYINAIIIKHYLLTGIIAIASHKYTLGLDYPPFSTCLVFIIRYRGDSKYSTEYL